MASLMPSSSSTHSSCVSIIPETSVDNVCDWLKSLPLTVEDCSNVVAKFRANDISGEILLSLSENDLKEQLDITSLGVRRKVYNAIQACKNSQTSGTRTVKDANSGSPGVNSESILPPPSTVIANTISSSSSVASASSAAASASNSASASCTAAQSQLNIQDGFTTSSLSLFPSSSLSSSSTSSVSSSGLPEMSTSNPFLQQLVEASRIEEKSALKAVETLDSNRESHAAALEKAMAAIARGSRPGGRHNNDFENFRSIEVAPTSNEIHCSELEYLPLAQEELKTMDDVLERNFRLLREDFVSSLKEEVLNEESSQWSFSGAEVFEYRMSQKSHREGQKPFRCNYFMVRLNSHHNKHWWIEHPNCLAYDSLVFLMRNDDKTVACFGRVAYRNEAELERERCIGIRAVSREHTYVFLDALSGHDKHKWTLVQCRGAFFAVEPVLLTLKEHYDGSIVFSEELIQWKKYMKIQASPFVIDWQSILESHRRNHALHFSGVNGATFSLNDGQEKALLYGLQNRVSLIQGPPGCGKSIIGSLIAKILHDRLDIKILCVCYTNHALDQFLLDLMAVGVQKDTFLRIGGKKKVREELKDTMLENKQEFSRGDRHFGSLYRRFMESLQEQESELQRCLEDEFPLENENQLVVNYLTRNHDTSDFMNFAFQCFCPPLAAVDFSSEREDGVLEKRSKEEGTFAFDTDGSADDALSSDEEESEDGFTFTLKSRHAKKARFLLDSWQDGKQKTEGDLQVLYAMKERRSSEEQKQFNEKMWKLNKTERMQLMQQWKDSAMKEKSKWLVQKITRYEDTLADLQTLKNQKFKAALHRSRIIGCTTTGAAKYRHLLQEAKPDVLIVEEAGEILEAHVLASLSKSVQQMILIGDHQQLRPKVNNYQLTVESNSGYELNRSLFERLVLQQYPFRTLSCQHRMHPDISYVVRTLIYPHLEDAKSVHEYPQLKGFPRRVIFVNHHQPELTHEQLQQQTQRKTRANIGAADENLKSKINEWEARFCVQTCIYLLHQGYQSKQLVVLTPYLGQLMTINTEMSKNKLAAELDDLDVNELYSLGVHIRISQSEEQQGSRRSKTSRSAHPSGKSSSSAAQSDTAAAANGTTNKSTDNVIRVATIDNYQGEESDVVIISLVRSNDRGEVGFVAEPERVNVLFSRARHGMIVFGNLETFTNARKPSASQLWQKAVHLFEERKYLCNGLPIVCELHPAENRVASDAEELKQFAPNGGCRAICGAKLPNCLHVCARFCHPDHRDHSQASCMEVIESTCAQGHLLNFRCHQKGTQEATRCQQCESIQHLLIETEKRRLEQLAGQQRAKHESELLVKRQQMELKTAEEQYVNEKARLEQEIASTLLGIEKKFFEEKLNLEKEYSGTVLQLKQQELNMAKEKELKRCKDRMEKEKAKLKIVLHMGQMSSYSEMKKIKTVATEKNDKDKMDDSKENLDVDDIHEKNKVNDNEDDEDDDDKMTEKNTSSPDMIDKMEDENIVNDWTKMKLLSGKTSSAIDDLVKMIGLTKVKRTLLAMFSKAKVSEQQGIDVSKQRFNALFIGNPGTGKTTVARLYGRFLFELGALTGQQFMETTGAKLINAGAPALQKTLQTLVSTVPAAAGAGNGSASGSSSGGAAVGGGVLFVDEAYQLVPHGVHSSASGGSGGMILDLLLTEMENHIGKLVVIFAGYKKQMEDVFAHNDGLPSRFPHSFIFEDYADNELLKILIGVFAEKNKTIRQPFHLEGGVNGLYARIACRRLGRGRNTRGFGNARAVQNLCDAILSRQAERLANEQKKNGSNIIGVDVFHVSKADIIGSPPANVLKSCDAWKELSEMIGLQKVKDSVQQLANLLQTNYELELREKPIRDVTLHRCFLGNPGTGKTTVAKLYGRILKSMQFLSKGDVILKTSSDFIGSVLGASEENTRKILENADGCVLVIDEAYALNANGVSGGPSRGSSDPYKEGVINTLVEKIQNQPGDNKCVLLLGYTKEMTDFISSANPGLSRRFDLANAFVFEDYTKDDLFQILSLKMKSAALMPASVSAQLAGIAVLEREMRRPNFGNGGAVDNLLKNAIQRMEGRLKNTDISAAQRVDMPLIETDFDPQWSSADQKSPARIDEFFSEAGIIGCDQVREKLKNLYSTILFEKRRGSGNVFKNIPCTFVFSGAAGTGKTTIARLLGKIFYEFGFLASQDVIETRAADFIPGFVGQTAGRTRELFKKAAGKVLFIDEAYGLMPSSSHSFAQEAVDEIVGCLTDLQFKGNLIVILAGYDKEMNMLLGANSGLKSRFMETYPFPDFTVDQCWSVLISLLANNQFGLPTDHRSLDTRMNELIHSPHWGNGRDLNMLSSRIQQLVIQEIMLNRQHQSSISPMSTASAAASPVAAAAGGAPTSSDSLTPSLSLHSSCSLSFSQAILVSLSHLGRAMEEMLKSKHDSSRGAMDRIPDSTGPDLPLPISQCANNLHPIALNSSIQQASKASNVEVRSIEFSVEQQLSKTGSSLERDGVGQRDAGVTDQEWNDLQAAIAAYEAEQQRRSERLAQLQRKAEEAERRLKEEERLKERERIANEQLDIENEREQLRQLQVKLQEAGSCPNGYQWYCLGGNRYQCAGGSHFVILD